MLARGHHCRRRQAEGGTDATAHGFSQTHKIIVEHHFERRIEQGQTFRRASLVHPRSRLQPAIAFDNLDRAFDEELGQVRGVGNQHRQLIQERGADRRRLRTAFARADGFNDHPFDMLAESIEKLFHHRPGQIPDGDLHLADGDFLFVC